MVMKNIKETKQVSLLNYINLTSPDFVSGQD